VPRDITMKQLRIVTVVCAFSLSIAQVKAEDQFLVDDGKANAEIIISESPARSTRLAARDLQTYIKKISGAELHIGSEPSGDFPVKLYVGASSYTGELGISADELRYGAYRIVSGKDWMVFIGDDTDFVPIEPWPRSNTDISSGKMQEAWDAITGENWGYPHRQLHKHYSGPNRLFGTPDEQKTDQDGNINIWTFDERGSFNAVCGFLRDLGVRWYMPGELGEVLPKTQDIALPEVDRTVRPKFEVRSVSRPLLSSPEIDDALWYLRLGANHQYGILHHGQRNLTEHPEQRAAHPEYYVQLANGERDNESRTANACLSSEGFFNETVAFARLMFDHYDIPVISVMPHDGFTHCQCDDCRDQITLDRGPSGLSSDYVWNFVVRVANELAKTHPDKKVFCGAYSSYRLPPVTIDKLPDNVFVQITNGRPIRELDDEVHESTAELRRQWRAKTNNPLSVTLNYTPFTNRGAYRPQYWPHVIARGIQACRDEVWREDVWLSSGKGGLHFPGMSHLNPYVISRFWWDADQDVDALLQEYYRLFYGPAANEMGAFVEFCEVEYARLGSDRERCGEKGSGEHDKGRAAPPASPVRESRGIGRDLQGTPRIRVHPSGTRGKRTADSPEGAL